MAALANAWDQEGGITADDPRLARMRLAVDALREWSLFKELQAPFTRFRYVFVASAAVMVVSVVYISYAVDQGLPISEPSEVMVSVSPAGARELLATTGCTDPQQSDFRAIGGTWEQPLLAVDGPDCEFGAHVAAELHPGRGQPP